MASLHEFTAPIPDTPESLRKSPNMLKGLQDSLENLQGNILRGYGRRHALHFFLRFKVDKQAEVKRWLKGLAPRITSAYDQLDRAERSRLFMSVFLSAKGYEYLGLPFPKAPHPFDDEP